MLAHQFSTLKLGQSPHNNQGISPTRQNLDTLANKEPIDFEEDGSFVSSRMDLEMDYL